MNLNWLSRLAAWYAPGRGPAPADQRHLELMLRIELMADTFTTKLDTLTTQVADLNQGVTAIWTRVQAKDVKMSALLAAAQAAGDQTATAENSAKLDAVTAQIAALLAMLPTIAPETDPAPTIAEAPAAFEPVVSSSSQPAAGA